MIWQGMARRGKVRHGMVGRGMARFFMKKTISLGGCGAAK